MEGMTLQTRESPSIDCERNLDNWHMRCQGDGQNQQRLFWSHGTWGHRGCCVLLCFLFCERLQLHHREESFALSWHLPKDTSGQVKISPSLKASDCSLLERCFCNAGGGEEKRHWEKEQGGSRVHHPVVQGYESQSNFSWKGLWTSLDPAESRPSLEQVDWKKYMSF